MTRCLYDVHLAGDTVVLVSVTYSQSNASAPAVAITRRVPAADEWRAFWRTVGAVGVRRWPASCDNTGVADGGGYTFALAWSDARRTGVYSGAYPTADGTCSTDTSRSGDAAGFQNAVYTIAGVPSVHALGAR